MLALGAAALALAGFGVVSVVVARALAPVSTLVDALQRLERGDRGVRMVAGDAPEFVAIASGVDALAETLARFDAENRALVERIIHVQDEERRDIARDLHDEIGPFLFSIRAGLGALARKLEGARRDDCLEIDGQLGALQQVNRRILGRLAAGGAGRDGPRGRAAGARPGLARSRSEGRRRPACRGAGNAARRVDRAHRLSHRPGRADQCVPPCERRAGRCDGGARCCGRTTANCASPCATTAPASPRRARRHRPARHGRARRGARRPADARRPPRRAARCSRRDLPLEAACEPA